MAAVRWISLFFWKDNYFTNCLIRVAAWLPAQPLKPDFDMPWAVMFQKCLSIYFWHALSWFWTMLWTHYDMYLTCHDMLLTHYDMYLTGHDMLPTHYDMYLTGYDMLPTQYDMSLTGHDLLQTHYDMYLTGYYTLSKHYTMLLTHYNTEYKVWVCTSAGLDPHVPPNFGFGSVGFMITYPGLQIGSVSTDMGVNY